jgi:hypothetical protein
MTDHKTTAVNQPAAGEAFAPPIALPDLNVGKNDWNFVQQLVDRAAWLNMFIVPEFKDDWGIRSAGGSSDVTGMRASGVIHRFDIDLQRPTLETGFRAVNRIGQASGKVHMRWMIIPNNFEARRSIEPPPTVLDPSLSQRFAIQEGAFAFGDGSDGFHSFGTGRTFPRVTEEGQQRVVVAAIGNVLDGFGKFSALEGTYVASGHLTPEYAFLGDIMIRIVDPERRLRVANALPPLAAGPQTEPGTTYLVMRSQKSGPEQRTTYSFTPEGKVRGLNVPQELVLAHVSFSSEGSAGIRSMIELGPTIGSEIGYVTTNPLRPDVDPGTADSPSRFQGAGLYSVKDPEGAVVGTFTAQFLEGRTFLMQLAGAPGQPAARFGFFGPILSGTRAFSDVDGMLLGSTGVAIAPHVFSNLYLLRLHDPAGKFRVVGSGQQE